MRYHVTGRSYPRPSGPANEEEHHAIVNVPGGDVTGNGASRAVMAADKAFKDFNGAYARAFNQVLDVRRARLGEHV